MKPAFDTYYKYQALSEILSTLAAEHPAIMALSTLGKSHEGRDIPLVILTNQATGPDLEKPGFYVDGNIHATELTASVATLYLVNRLVQSYGSDAKITRILDEQVVYVVPRLNPDGAEAALADRPRFVRSGTRPYPYAEKQEGLHEEDVDGDGRILQMRIADPTGDWKVSDRDPRLMVKRAPDDEGGQYYRLFDEGLLESYDGVMIKPARAFAGLDFNRNFPGQWRPEGEQVGAGAYPGSEPEIRAVVDFMAQHPNIYGALTYHTFSRAILRPYGTKSDDEMDTQDKWVFEAIGERGTELTGYPSVSVYHHFRYHPKEVITGVFDDWLFDHKGIFAYTVELWDLPTAAGVEEKSKDKKFMDWFRKHPAADDHKILDFVAQHAPDALVPWYAFAHPQLGPVELGGWNPMYSWRNPPHSLLEAEVAPQSDFAIAFASLAPRLRWRDVKVTPLGEDAYHILAVVENAGFLPTYVSQRGADDEGRAPCATGNRAGRRRRAGGRQAEDRNRPTRRPVKQARRGRTLGRLADRQPRQGRVGRAGQTRRHCRAVCRQRTRRDHQAHRASRLSGCEQQIPWRLQRLNRAVRQLPRVPRPGCCSLSPRLALLLRGWAIGSKALWYDEAATLAFARAPVPQIVAFHWQSAFEHPPVWAVLMHYWIALFGQSEASLRWPSALAGAAMPWATWLLGRNLWPRARVARLAAALLVAISPIFIQFGQEARMYALAGLLSTLSLALLVRLMRGIRPALLVCFILANWVMAALQYYYALLFVVEGLVLLAFLPRAPRRFAALLAAVAVSAVPTALWIGLAPGFRATLATVTGGTSARSQNRWHTLPVSGATSATAPCPFSPLRPR